MPLNIGKLLGKIIKIATILQSLWEIIKGTKSKKKQ